MLERSTCIRHKCNFLQCQATGVSIYTVYGLDTELEKLLIIPLLLSLKVVVTRMCKPLKTKNSINKVNINLQSSIQNDKND